MKKKKIILLLLFLLLLGITLFLIDNNKKIVVCIDAGHGGDDVGAILANRYEKNDTLKMAKLVEKHLKEKNIKVIMTRSHDSSVSLDKRCKIANKKNAKLFVSIHRNSAETGNGVEIWCNSQEREQDTLLANSILNHLKNFPLQNNRGIKYGTINGKDSDYYVLNYTNMPSCLIELGFISNEQDNQLLDNYNNDYAKAIADGICLVLKDNDGKL